MNPCSIIRSAREMCCLYSLLIRTGRDGSAVSRETCCATKGAMLEPRLVDDHGVRATRRSRLRHRGCRSPQTGPCASLQTEPASFHMKRSSAVPWSIRPGCPYGLALPRHSIRDALVAPRRPGPVIAACTEYTGREGRRCEARTSVSRGTSWNLMEPWTWTRE